jgi:hypothetical protein
MKFIVVEGETMRPDDSAHPHLHPDPLRCKVESADRGLLRHSATSKDACLAQARGGLFHDHFTGAGVYPPSKRRGRTFSARFLRYR